MENTSTTFLITAELNRAGFIVGFKNTLAEAESVSQRLIRSFDDIPLTDERADRICNILRKRNYPTYKINRNQLMMDKGVVGGSSDAMIAVWVVEVEMGDQAMQIFMKERENYSLVFKSEELDDAFIDKFPELNIIAN